MPSLYSVVEKRFTVAQTDKKSSPAKATGQRIDMMDVFYSAVKAYKKRTAKPTSASTMETSAWLHYFGSDLLVGLATLQVADRKRPTPLLSVAAELSGPGSSTNKQRTAALAATDAKMQAKRQKVEDVKIAA